MKHVIQINSLTKADAKELKKVVAAWGGAPTVKDVRMFVSPGKKMMIFYMVLLFLFMLGIGLVFFPFIILALLSPFYVWFKTWADRDKWLGILPEDKDDCIVKLV